MYYIILLIVSINKLNYTFIEYKYKFVFTQINILVCGINFVNKNKLNGDKTK